MICFQVSVNGRGVCTAGVGEKAADMSAVLCAVGGSLSVAGELQKVSLDVVGTADDVQLSWLEAFDGLGIGDTVTIAIVERDGADPPRTRHTGRTLAMSRDDAQSEAELSCAFCHRPEGDARTLIAGPPVFICSSCVAVCQSVLKGDAALRDDPA